MKYSTSCFKFGPGLNLLTTLPIVCLAKCLRLYKASNPKTSRKDPQSSAAHQNQPVIKGIRTRIEQSQDQKVWRAWSIFSSLCSILGPLVLSQKKATMKCSNIRMRISVYRCNHSAQWGKAVSVPSRFNSQIPIVDMITQRLTNVLRHWEKKLGKFQVKTSH